MKSVLQKGELGVWNLWNFLSLQHWHCTIKYKIAFDTTEPSHPTDPRSLTDHWAEYIVFMYNFHYSLWEHFNYKHCKSTLIINSALSKFQFQMNTEDF